MSTPDMQTQALQQLLNDRTEPGALYERLEDGRLLCYACGHECKIGDGKTGVCRVRFNEGGRLRVPMNYIGALQCDPIEKKPFFHAFPGRAALSFGMLGCDLHCGYCQNWVTSQALRDPRSTLKAQDVSAADLVGLARRYGAPVITSTYNEPLITAEWAVRVMEMGKREGFVGSFVSNGNATLRALEFIRPYVQLYKVDLKSFQDKEYRKLGGQLDNVLRTIRQLHQMGFWLEIVTLIVPGLNDSHEELREMARFLASVSRDIPWHVTAFHSDYKMQDRDATQTARLIEACQIGVEEGLRYVYAGNRPSAVGEWENTRCPGCSQTLIARSGYVIYYNRLSRGRCPDCDMAIPGFWAKDCIVPQEGAGRSAWLMENPGSLAGGAA